MRPHLPSVAFVSCVLWSAAFASAAGGDARLPREAAAAIERAATYFYQQVATRGGYVYFYTPDLNTRWGEGLADAEQIWVQPPATPTVGMAFLKAFEATGREEYLSAATEAAEALVYGQLESGGWTNRIDFNPKGAGVAQYRSGQGRGRNYSTLDDGITQSAIRLLAHVDRAHRFEHEQIHEAALFALDALLSAQFPNGAFPQVWDGPVAKTPIVKANYPRHDWRTEGRIKEYWNMYTLNDGVAGYVSVTLQDAYQTYEQPRYKAALERLGDFLVLAQMPYPQPAWAQQYNYEMQPIWARKFEPPAVSGGESQDVIATLLRIYRFTGNKNYLEPIPRALNYLERSLLPDGQLARYYELKSNKPLYMSRRGDTYSLTYDDSQLPSHYGWKVPSQLSALRAEYERLVNGVARPDRKPDLQEHVGEVRRIIAELDAQGRWVTRYKGERMVGQAKFALGAPYISSEIFSRNLETLSDYLLAEEDNGN